MAAMWGTAAASASAGVVALWHMDERSGTSMLDSAGGHTGMLHSVSLGVAGFLGTAYGFGSGYVSVPAASDLNPGGNTLTITIHAKGLLLRNTGPNDVPAVGDTFLQDGSPFADDFRTEDAIDHGMAAGGTTKRPNQGAGRDVTAVSGDRAE